MKRYKWVVLDLPPKSFDQKLILVVCEHRFWLTAMSCRIGMGVATRRWTGFAVALRSEWR